MTLLKEDKPTTPKPPPKAPAQARMHIGSPLTKNGKLPVDLSFRVGVEFGGGFALGVFIVSVFLIPAIACVMSLLGLGALSFGV